MPAEKERKIMQKLVINGEKRLGGELKVQGAKNSALPLLAACMLAKGETQLTNCPRLRDVFAAVRILGCLGCRCTVSGNTVIVDAKEPCGCCVPEELMREMRSSIVFLGAVLGRAGECMLSFPGGCELGPRPIDIHLDAQRKMGAEITEQHGELICTTPGGLHGADMTLPFPSVGATENIILAAALAKGDTIIKNAAREPEITDLAGFLTACGAKISGAGTDTVTVRGVDELRGCEYKVMPDRIAACTYLAAAAMTGGEITLTDVRAEELDSFIKVLELSGCSVYNYKDRLFLSVPERLRPVGTVRTMPYPGFPTDAQALMTALLTKAKGTSVIVETIFENRFHHVPELVRMGARIRVEGRVAIIEGGGKLYGANVMAADLRGGAALVLAGLAAQGTTTVSNIKLIDRGYEEIEKALSSLGADIARI